MADSTPPNGPVNAESSSATKTDQFPAAQDEAAPGPAPGLMTAGAPGWYSLVATSFLICEFDPIGAIGLAAGISATPRSPLGWALTVASFMLALSGFIYAEWRASVDGNRRALVICSIITIAAGVIPCISAISIPALIAWPIGMMFLVTGGSGLRVARQLAAGTPAAAPEPEPVPAPAPAPPSDEQYPSSGGVKRRRRRRRSRNRKRQPPAQN